MVGAASEKAILLLMEKYADSIQSERNRERFLQRYNKRDISVKYQEFTKSFGGCKNRPTHPVLARNIDVFIGNTFQFCRISRNEVGHPITVPNPSREVVIANLHHLIVYLERIYMLMKHFDENGVIL